MSCTARSISNGYTLSSQSLYNVNDTVTYYCNQYYTLSGNPVATCLDSSGTWSDIPSCKLSSTDNVWFWMTVGLASLLALVLLLILLIVLIRYCCCHHRKNRVSEYDRGQDRYGDSCGPCCGFVDYKGCCSLYGCCGFYGCCGGFCGCCRCCREFPSDSDSRGDNRNSNSSNNSTPPKKKKVSVRQTQTSPTPTDVTLDEKKKLAKMNDIYIISNHVESTPPTSRRLPKKVHTSATQTITKSRDVTSEGSMTSDEKNKKKTAKVIAAWIPHTHEVRPINTSTK